MTTDTQAIRAGDGNLQAPDDWQHLKPYGYAPGGYMGRCHRCDTIAEFIDKRATTCRPCAEKMHEASRAALEKVQL